MNESPDRNRMPDEPPRAPAPPIPPPLPRAGWRTPGDDMELDADYAPIQGPITMAAVAEAVLRRPGSLACEIAEGRLSEVGARLFRIMVLCLAAYGCVMGSFSGGVQLAGAPLRLIIGTILSALICLPSLYIFTSMAGARQGIAQTAALLALFLALQGILLLGLAPVAWIFSQSTKALAFMGTLHLAIWCAATLFGLRLLGAAFGSLNRRDMSIVRVWGVVFILVALQMSTTLRPLIGKPGPLPLEDKRFFLEHWGKCMN